MKMKAAQALIKCLELEEVEIIFGYPGGAVLPIYDALYGKRIKHVLVRQEQGAVHAANGYARVTGKTGVVLATSGPGATNLVTGIANAYMDSIPVVLITGQVSTGMVGTDAFQEVDITGITIPITKHNYLVKNAQDLPRIIKQAFYLARSGRPGPVLIDIPRDVQEQEIEFAIPEDFRPQGYKPTYRGNARQVKLAAELLNQAQRPVLYVGGGAIHAGAQPELVALAEKLQAPVTTTLMGLGAFPGGHPLALGMLGLHGWKSANLAVQNCDVLVSLGARFDDRVTGAVEKFAPQARIIHIDIDPAEIGKNVRVDVPIVGDVRLVLQDLLPRLESVASREEWLAQIRQWQRQYPLPTPREKSCPQAQIQGWEVIQALYRLTGGEAIIVTDVGQHQMWAAQHFPVNRPRSFLSSGGLGTMGYGMPAAVGAQMGRPGEKVILITGDGSFQMSMNEFGTAVEQGLPVKVIVLNNRQLAMVRQLQEFYCGGRYLGVDYTGQPDFAMFARCYGARGYSINRREELEALLKEALTEKGPVIVDISVCGRENVYPMVLGGCGLEEAITSKEEWNG
ncbi:MAG: biosynthetic-type acetolactate synthase large subunit [Bacillota bacterium]